MYITVYLGALAGNDPSLADAVRELGSWIGESGNTLVYGGSKTGLMGEIAKSVLAAGGNVIGVEPQFLIDEGCQYEGLTELIVTADMTERKAKMIELGEAFIAFPGGTGTLEEIAEVMSKVSLRQLDAPCIWYNLNGYYDAQKAQLNHMIEMGLSSAARQKGIFFAESLAEIKKILLNRDDTEKQFHLTGIFDCGGSEHETIRNAGENAAAVKKIGGDLGRFCSGDASFSF